LTSEVVVSSGKGCGRGEETESADTVVWVSTWGSAAKSPLVEVREWAANKIEEDSEGVAVIL